MNKLLIANRGEIACRIIRTARQLGLQTVAVYSDADRDAMHVETADEAIALGAAAPTASYLDHTKVLEAARATGADAIHPGYGFLSENAVFATACEQAGIIFVGPPVSAIEAMGSKSAAKSIMERAGVPLLPGYHGDDQSDTTLADAAENIGYPVLLKATAGGGGKGMRIVHSADEFTDALRDAKQEARNAFGDDRMLVEKFLAAPRHIEVQVFADRHGHCVHLFDRDCSIQRRYQKIIEEAPAPGLSNDLRERMASAAIAAAKAIDYVGAGTVEFLVDGDEFFFMEMNTRLQVEHPVTEAITGVDLVAWQLRVANGDPLPASQADIHKTGHAIEARLYAEDADAGFLPTSGPIDALHWPDVTPTPRIDTGVRAGDNVSIYYDPMIAKMVHHANDRTTAIRLLTASLADTLMLGLTTNIDFLLRVLSHPAFSALAPTTAFLTEQADSLLKPEPDAQTMAAATVALWHQRQSNQPDSPWHTGDGWWPNLPAVVRDTVRVGATEADMVLHFADGATQPTGVSWQDQTLVIDDLTIDGPVLTITLYGKRQRAVYLMDGPRGVLSMGAAQWSIEHVPPDLGETSAAASDGNVRAPMTGRVVEIHVEPGTAVSAGDTLIVMEAMKMAHTLTAPIDGLLAECRVQTDQLVDGGQVIAVIEPHSD